MSADIHFEARYLKEKPLTGRERVHGATPRIIRIEATSWSQAVKQAEEQCPCKHRLQNLALFDN